MFPTFFLVLIVSTLLVEAIPFDPENDADRAIYLDELEQTLDSVRRALEIGTAVPRQEDEEESSSGGLNPIATGILKIVGSALAGNITSVIDNSVALFPSEANVDNRISNVLGVLVESVRNATGLAFGRATSTTKRTPSKATKVTTTTTQLTTNSEEDEEEQELRTNTTATIKSSTVVPNPVSLAAGINNITTAPSTTIPTTTPPVDLDSDNRANWASLLFNGSDSLQNLKDVGSTPVAPQNGNSFGSKLNLLLLLNPNKPNFSNYSAILHKFDQLQGSTNLETPQVQDETTTVAIIAKVPTRAATLTTGAAAPAGNGTEDASVGPISVFTQFVTEQTTEDDDEDEDEDDNVART